MDDIFRLINEGLREGWQKGRDFERQINLLLLLRSKYSSNFVIYLQLLDRGSRANSECFKSIGNPVQGQ